MILAHDTEVALTSSAALVNTGRGGEELPDEAALVNVLACETRARIGSCA